MIYIKHSGDEVVLGSSVATDDMLSDGWIPYYGEIPNGSAFTLENGVLVPILTKDKEEKILEIKKSFINQLSLGYTCSNGITMDTEQSKVDLMKSGYDLAIKLNQTVMNIRDYNNTLHIDIPLADVDVMITELGVNISTQLSKKWQLEDLVNNATTQADLDLIVW